MPSIYAVMAAFNRQLAKLEAGATMEMAERWKEIEARLWGYFLALVDDIERNGLKTDAQIYQLFRYQTLLKIALDEITKYEQWAQGRVEEMQQQAIDLGVAAAIASLNGAQYFAPTGNIAALKNMVGVCADGAPVFSILSQRALSPEAVAGLTAALLEGVALGYNPRKTARKMADGLAGGLDKALTIARTEQIRAFREANRQQYADMGVKLYQRHCAHSDRTCTACLGLDGEIYSTDELFASHPNCRCFMTAYDAERAKRYPNAQEWFAGLDEARQKEILGPGHYKLYKEGMPLKDMVKVTDDPVWGPTIGVKPLKEIGVEMVASSQTSDDPDMQRAKKGKLFDLRTIEDDVIVSNAIDLSEIYKDNLFQANKVLLTGKQKKYIYFGHKDEIWFNNNQDLVIKAIRAPMFLDKEPRYFGKNTAKVAHIIYIGEQENALDYLNVVLSFHRNKNKIAQIWTMFRANEKYIMEKDGKINERWLQIKK